MPRRSRRRSEASSEMVSLSTDSKPASPLTGGKTGPLSTGSQTAALLTVGDAASGILLDRSRRFRYHLWRRWDESKARLCFIMLNPSTADHERNDPTIARCVSFAKDWRCGSLDVVNLFALRSTDSSYLRQVKDPVGPHNDRIIIEVAQKADLIVVAWGNHGALLERYRQVLDLLPVAQALQCFGVNLSGQPRHPLYVASATPLGPFTKLRT
jgi:hypothetical protein